MICVEYLTTEAHRGTHRVPLSKTQGTHYKSYRAKKLEEHDGFLDFHKP